MRRSKGRAKPERDWFATRKAGIGARMTRGRLFRIGLLPFDVLVVGGIVLTSVLAWRGLRMVEFGALPLLAAPFFWRRALPDRNDWLTIALFAQYAVILSLNIALYAPMGESARGGGEDALLYLGAAVLLALMVVRIRLTVDLALLWRVVGPPVVLVSVALLGWDHFTAPPEDACRVGFMAKQLLFPPIWLTMFAYAGYFGWDRLNGWERALRHLAVAAVIVATVAFSGARAMLLAQALTLPVLALLLGWGEPMARRLRIVALLGVVSFAAFLAGLALDLRAGCMFSDRLMAIATTVTRAGEAEEITVRKYEQRLGEDAEERLGEEPEAAPGPPAETTPDVAVSGEAPEAADEAAALDEADKLVGAVYIRPLLWQLAARRIAERPIAGYGYVNEPPLLEGSFDHYHQQYLSWLVWGGPLMLLSGLAMLFAPLVTFHPAQSRDNAVLALAMIGPLAIVFLAATSLLHTVMVLGYAVTLALFHALARQSERTVSHGGDG